MSPKTFSSASAARLVPGPDTKQQIQELKRARTNKHTIFAAAQTWTDADIHNFAESLVDAAFKHVGCSPAQYADAFDACVKKFISSEQAQKRTLTEYGGYNEVRKFLPEVENQIAVTGQNYYLNAPLLVGLFIQFETTKQGGGVFDSLNRLNQFAYLRTAIINHRANENYHFFPVEDVATASLVPPPPCKALRLPAASGSSSSSANSAGGSSSANVDDGSSYVDDAQLSSTDQGAQDSPILRGPSARLYTHSSVRSEEVRSQRDLDYTDTLNQERDELLDNNRLNAARTQSGNERRFFREPENHALRTAQDRIQHLEDVTEERHTRIRTLETQNADTARDLITCQAENAELRHQLGRKTRQYDVKKKRLHVLQGLRETDQQTIANLRQENAQLQLQLDEANFNYGNEIQAAIAETESSEDDQGS